MASSDFVVLLARQRSGTNVLRATLGTHPEIACLREIFDSFEVDSPDEEIRQANYFRWFRDLLAREPARLYAQDDEETFLQYLDSLRSLRREPHIVLDVKYMSTHHVRKNWKFISEEPFLFDVLRRHGVRVLHLTRRNHLRYYLSDRKAEHTRRWHQTSRHPVRDEPITVDPEHLLRTLRLCAEEDRIVRASFEGYHALLSFDYDDMFPALGAPVAADVLARVADWLGVEPRFSARRSRFQKLATLPLRDSIANFDDVAAVLRGTSYEPFLEDERMFTTAPRSSTSQSSST